MSTGTIPYGDGPYGGGQNTGGGLPPGSVGIGGYGTVPYGDELYGGGTNSFASAAPLAAEASADCIPAFVQVLEPPPPYQPSSIIYNDLVIFETPNVRDRPPYLPDSSRREIMLMRHFENRLRGVLVWRRSDGTFCVDTPCNYEKAQTNPNGYIQDDPIGPDLTTSYVGTTGVSTEFANDAALGPDQGVPAPPPTLADSNVNFPWNPFVGSTNSQTPGSYAYNTNWDQSTQDFALNPYLKEWWEGGAENIVSQEEALELTAAGFGDCLRAAEQGTVGTIYADGYDPYTGSGDVFKPTDVGVGPPLPPPPSEAIPNEADGVGIAVNPVITIGLPVTPGQQTATAIAAGITPTITVNGTMGAAAAQAVGVKPGISLVGGSVVTTSPLEADATAAGVAPVVTFGVAVAYATGAGITPTVTTNTSGGAPTSAPAEALGVRPTITLNQGVTLIVPTTAASATGTGVTPTVTGNAGFGIGPFGQGAFGG